MSEDSEQPSSDQADDLLPMLLVGNGIIGGMEEYVLSLLREFRRRGQRALVAAPFLGEFTNTLLEQGHPPEDFYVLDMPWWQLNFRALAHLVTILRAREVSLIHAHLLPADILGGPAAAIAGIPFLSTLHGTLHNIEEVLLRDLCAANYVTVSRAGEASAIANGLPAEAVRYVPNGVHVERLDPARYNREAIRRELGVRSDQLLVSCVARLSPEKNPLGFLRAAELAGTRDPRLVFLMIGTGQEEPEIRRLQAQSPLGNRLRLLGLRKDVPALLAASDLFGLASSTESLPFAVMEAMAMRLPVVCYDVGGLRELISDGKTGFLVPFGETERFAARILGLASDPALRERIGAEARATILANHDFNHTAAATLAIYRELVNRGSGSGRKSALIPLDRRVAVSAPKARDARGNGRGTQEAPPLLPDVPVVDSHLHLSGSETASEVLETLDAAGVHAACLIGPFIDTGAWVPVTGAALGRANEFLLRLIADAPEQLWGLVTVDPQSRSAPRDLVALSQAPGVRGVKLIPHGWTPDGPGAMRVYEAAEECGLPILFHSGIFISGRASDSCRPARYEAVRRFPKLRVVLAHLGWPWVDEAIAVAFMDLLKGQPPQILLDTSPGTPPIYRRDALHKALDVLGPAPLLWGCDRFLPIDPGVIRDILGADVAEFRTLGADEPALRRIFSENAAELFASTTELVSAPDGEEVRARP